MELQATIKGPIYPDIRVRLSYEEKGEVIQLTVCKALFRWWGGMCGDAARFVDECREATRQDLMFAVEKYVDVTWY